MVAARSTLNDDDVVIPEEFLLSNPNRYMLRLSDPKLHLSADLTLMLLLLSWQHGHFNSPSEQGCNYPRRSNSGRLNRFVLAVTL